MVDLWAVVVLIVGIILTFVGAFMVFIASSLKKPVEVLHVRVDSHDQRLSLLEAGAAARSVQIESILTGIAELRRMLEKHTDDGR